MAALRAGGGAPRLTASAVRGVSSRPRFLSLSTHLDKGSLNTRGFFFLNQDADAATNSDDASADTDACY